MAEIGDMEKTYEKKVVNESEESTDFEAECFERNERKNWMFSVGGRKWGVRINPVSFIGSVVLIWGFAIWCMVDKENASVQLDDVQRWITDTLTWAYMGTQQIWVVFLVVLYVSRLGGVKLGKPNDEPEYPDASWFMMMFSAGIGIGLFFFGVAEPVWHYEPCYGRTFAGEGSDCFGNRYAQLTSDLRAQWAINLTYFHWGVHAWVAYCVVGLLLAAVVYRKDLPMTMKSAFYPILGDKIFGWMGDAIDTVSVATTLFGVCTSLGLGVIQLNAGLNRMNESIGINQTSQAIIIWSITALATISVVSGVKVGIRRLSEINWLTAQFIAFYFLFMEDTFYILNVLTQSLGFYIQWFVQLGNWCNAFVNSPEETVTEGNGDSIHITSIASDGTATDRNWMNSWTIFYWGWWIAWAPFVGMFIAKISRGRTVRNIINGAMTGPVLYSFFWFAVFGGIGLRIEREAANLGVGCDFDDYDGLVREPKVTIDGLDYYRLSCRASEDQWFDMVHNFPLSRFFSGLSIASLILYFVTSSDSGSLVIDCLTSNGNPSPPVFQRIFWSCTEGAVAMALLFVGGEDSLGALRSVSIVAGVPYTIVICFMCKALWSILAEEYNKEHGIIPRQYNEWRTGVIDVLDYPTFNAQQAVKCLAALFIPFFYSGRGGANSLDMKPGVLIGIHGFMFLGWLIFLIANVGQRGLCMIGWILYVAYGFHMAYCRMAMRQKRNIRGDILSDVIISMVLYPFVAVQLHDEAIAIDEDGKASSEAAESA